VAPSHQRASAPKASRSRRRRRGGIAAASVVLAVTAGFAVANITNAGDLLANSRRTDFTRSFPIESLDGRGNNVANPSWGQSNRPYSRVGAAHYADGIGAPVAGPNARAASNRIISDDRTNVFSERRVSQWGLTWGQFLDHTFGNRQDEGSTATPFNIPFNANDPLEEFSTNLGVITMNRSAQAPGTGTSTSNPRQQTNLLPSYISGNPVYGATNARLDWLREGSQDGNPTNNRATLLLPNNYLPRKTARGNPASAPAMATDGRLLANPNNAAVAGDVRANENIALTATHTLFAREHNRIVGLLPNSLSQEEKFQIARRVVIAEEQYITYQEWLPAMGVALPQYTGYKSNVDTSLSNEFATVGYRAHSQIHGEFEIEVAVGHYTDAQLNSFKAQGIGVTVDGDEVALAVPLNVAFFNPNLLEQIGAGPMLQALGAESQYNNDESIDNGMRSALFQIPTSNDNECLVEVEAECFNGVNDLGAIDIARARDHGIGTYNQLRQAYGLPAKTSFTSITGESTDQFPPGVTIDTPGLDKVTALFDIDGKAVDLDDEDAVEATGTRDVRRTTVAARLRGVYGNVNNIDAFAGLIAERHVPGTEFGELQLAMWTREFQKLRDGDRFFYGNDPGLSYIRNTYGIDFRHTLAQVITANTDVEEDEISSNVFLVKDVDLPATTCAVSYTVRPADRGTFRTDLRITNTGTSTINRWTLRWEFANGQRIRTDTNINVLQRGPNGRDVTATDVLFNATIAPGRSVDASFTASRDNVANAKPPNISLNGNRCAVT